MLINSKKNTKRGGIVPLAVICFIVLALLKFTVDSKPGFFGINSFSNKTNPDIETPVELVSNLYTEDLLEGAKNQIYAKDHFTLYLNNELGAPTLMAVYKDSLSDMERDGRFIAYLYLKDPSDWRRANRQKDHILLVKEKLYPIEKEIDGHTYYIFKFRLEHPYFKFENLKKLRFVRLVPQISPFNEFIIEKDSLPPIYTISNSFKNLQLSLKSKSLEKITKKRDEALKLGILVSSDDDFVKAKISAEGKKDISASIRLKGDWTDHLEHASKWSFRIVPEGENTLFGMRKFSVQHPKSRNYAWEWLFNKVVKDNDLIGLRYDFINVTMKLTDKDSIIKMGIMALEESFDKILIESNNRREGLILGLDETMIWDDRKQVKALHLDYPEDLNVPKVSMLPIKIYNENKTLSTPNLAKQFEVAKNLMVGLRDGKLKLSEVFDVDRLTFYIALSNLFGGHHGLMPENIRVYYNPVTHLLEPVSFDSNSGMKIRTLRSYPIGKSDKVFQAKLRENYEKVSSAKFIKAFLTKYLKNANAISLGLCGEFNNVSLDIEVLEHNANMIKKTINPNTSIEASLISFEKESMQLEVRNFSEFPVIIDALVLENGKSLNQVKQQVIIAPGDSSKVGFQMKRSFNNAFVSKKNKEGGFRFPKDLAKVRLRHYFVGSDLSRYSNIQAFSSTLDFGIIKNLFVKDNVKEFDFIRFDESLGTLSFIAGEFQLNKTLFIPGKYKVNIEPGFQLDITSEASIISYAPFHAMGTNENPIRFVSTDNTGGGIFVSSTSEKSVLEHTYFNGLSIPKVDYWELSGSVNFNEADVDLSHCVFKKNRSEDALNVIRSNFTLDQSTFIDTYSDAFDGDFVEGSITNSTFVNSGNDGIDVSGSNLTLANIVIENPSDKGLSAGEGSTMTGNKIKVNGGEIGVVSKDLSTITLTDVIIENTRLGIACFQKKSEFGPGIVNLKNLRFSGIEVPYLIAKNSDLIIDDVVMQDKSEDVIDKMYGNEYGKSSK